MTANNEVFSEAPGTRAQDPSAKSLAEWVARVGGQRDEEAFAALYEHFAPRLKRYMMRLGATQDAADDLVQESMVTLWRRAESYRPDAAAVSTWMFTIARNLRIDRLRRTKFVEIPLPEDHGEREASEDDHQAQLDGGRLLDLMKQLPPEQFEVLQLVYLEGLSHSEIAIRLSLPLGTVKSRLRRALSKLREMSEGL